VENSSERLNVKAMPYTNSHNAKAMPIIASVGDSGAKFIQV
jgi:hypothetical protein